MILNEERESLEFIFIFPSILAIWIKSVDLIRYRKSSRLSEQLILIIQTAILTSLVIAFDGFFYLVNHTSGGKFLIIAQPFNKSWWSWLLNNLRFDRFMFIWILRCNNNLILWHVWKNQHLSLQISSMKILHQGAHFIFFQINDNYFNKGTIKACV